MRKVIQEHTQDIKNIADLGFEPPGRREVTATLPFLNTETFLSAHFFNIRAAYFYRGRDIVELRVDMGDLQSEKERLSSFLQLKLKANVVPVGDKLSVKSEKLYAQELQRVVTKFVYHRNLNSTHWVSVEGSTVKINRFKGTAKKKEKRKKDTLHQTAIQSWGL